MEREFHKREYLGHPTHHLVRELDIQLDEEDIYSGTALKMMSRAPYDGCAFPMVFRIVFVVYLGDNIRAKPSVAAANISALVKRIKQAAPRAQAFQLNPNTCKAIDHSTSDLFDDLATQLFRLVGQIELCPFSGHSDLRELQLQGVYKLVRIKHTTGHSIGTFTRLARQSASTLESLDIFILETNGAICIIQDSDGTCAIYPRLTTLCLDGDSDDSDILPPGSKDVVPFPSLRRLMSRFKYPLGDDTFLRGNSATLEYLSMPLTRSTVAMLQKHSIFTPQSHPRLRHVNIECHYDLVPDSFATNTKALQFILGIGTKAPTRLTNLPVTGAELIGVIPSLNNLTSVQVLSLNWTTLDLWQAIALLKTLPLLSDLRTLPPVIGPLPADVALDDLPAHVVSTFAPMGTKFRLWHLFDPDDRNTMDDSLSCVLLLALVCPNFFRITANFIGYNQSLEMIEEAITSDMFKPYASRLQHIQLHGRSY
ncbi:hypothetical protein GGI09_002179 [Coemansia sp. S100]|nr:hypothetical protein LPJ71_004569 [Coemansia sp. S17]KAJ2100636.1 hypothetical protein GGI09_002179 [Coemansia sp. S100]KAJ2107513.1 hypothetical protein GGI16_001496 [Coemansia sp. S142-1]